MSEDVFQPEAFSFISLSRRFIWGMVLLLIFLTGFLMMVFMKFDMEEFFLSDQLAIKVGGTSIRMSEFKQIKGLSAPEADSLSDQAFAGELLETLVWAEAGRDLGLDRQEKFLANIRLFDQAIALSSGPIDISKALFLIEELARTTREKVMSSAEGIPEMPPAGSATEPSIVPEKLHLKTILLPPGSSPTQLFLDAAAGVPFEALNASFSKSLYAPVGGDISWKTPGDLPPGVFEKIAAVPVGSISLGFTDEEGTHLFRLEARPEAGATLTRKLAQGRAVSENQKQALERFFQTMKRTVPMFIHQSLALSGGVPDAGH